MTFLHVVSISVIMFASVTKIAVSCDYVENKSKSSHLYIAVVY